MKRHSLPLLTALALYVGVACAGTGSDLWPEEIIDSMDGKRLVVFLPNADILASPQWLPDEGAPPPLSITEAITDLKHWMASDPRYREDEIHEIIGRKMFRTCLGLIEELEGKPFKHAQKLPKRTCRHANKDVYGLKSTTKFPDWWYDYRVSFVDTKSFADYRTVYYKDGQLVKVIDRDWGLVSDSGKRDPRALFWKYWYGLDLTDGRESWAQSVD